MAGQQTARASSAPPHPISASLVAGVVCGFVAVVSSIGNGSLLFSSGLPEYLPVAVGLGLFSTAVMATTVALLSSARGLVAHTQEVPAVALSAILVAVAGAMPAGAPEAARFATVMVTLALGTLSIGVAALVIGWFRLGGIVRFIPYPVIGGFLAGTGWLVVAGGLKLMLGQPVTASLLTTPPDPATLGRIAIGIAFAALVAFGRARLTTALFVPALILAALIAFNLAAFATGAGTDALRAAGWLIDFPESGRMWPAISPADVALADWGAILTGALGIPTMVIVSIISFLMNATGIELAIRRDLDLNRELRVIGVMNLIAGAGAAASGYHSFALSTLSARLGGSRAIVGLTVAAFCVAALVFGRYVLAAVPTFVLGGLLLWIGGTQLFEWLVRSYRRLSRFEYLVILLIFFIIIGVNLAIGIVTGIVAAVILFVVEYGRIDIVRHEMTGTDYQSGSDGPEKRRDLLQSRGHAILILRLQGYLFFGTAERLRRRVEQRMLNESPRPEFLIIDFRRVSGLDSSAVASFIRLAQTAEREGFTLTITGLGRPPAEALSRGGFSAKAFAGVHFDSDIERGLKWCEDRVIAELSPELSALRQPIDRIIADIVEDDDATGTIAAECERIDIGSGETLIERNAPSDDIYFIEAGHAAVEIQSEAGEGSIRLATVGPGAIVGEVAFYLGEQRSASIIAEEPMTVWRLSRAAMDRLETAAPAAAMHFHEGLAAILAKRLTRTNRIVRFLAD